MATNREEDQDQLSVIVIEEERLKETFTQIPNTILRREDLTAGAKLTYIGLLSYAWQSGSCFPGQVALAKDIGVGERSLVRYLKELQEKGLLRVKRRGLGQTNIYTLAKWVEPRSAKLADQELPKTTPLEVPNWHPKNTQGNNTQENNTQLSNTLERLNVHTTFSSKNSKVRKIEKNERIDATQSEQTRNHPTADGFTSIGQVLLKRTAVADTHQSPKNMAKASGRGESGLSHPKSKSLYSSRPKYPLSPYLSQVVKDLSTEFHDAQSTDSNLSFIGRVQAETGFPDSTMGQLIQEARLASKSRANIHKAASGEAGELGLRNRWPYFRATLLDLVTQEGKQVAARRAGPAQGRAKKGNDQQKSSPGPP